MSKLSLVYYYMLLAALALAAASYWAPWVDHDAAALTLSGQDMGEFVKFLPDLPDSAQAVREGLAAARQIPRQFHYMSPFACSVCLTMLAANKRISYPGWLRATVLVGAALLLLGLLPPVWGRPKELIVGEFRWQGYAIILGALFILGHGILCRISVRWLALVVSGLALLVLVLAQGAFWLVLPVLWAAYNTPTLSLGWGLGLHVAAWAAALALGAHIYISKKES